MIRLMDIQDIGVLGGLMGGYGGKEILSTELLLENIFIGRKTVALVTQYLLITMTL